MLQIKHLFVGFFIAQSCFSQLEKVPINKLPIYRGREWLNSDQIDTIWNRFETQQLSTRRKVVNYRRRFQWRDLDQKVFEGIDPEKSLLIHDCGSWCDMFDLSFRTIFSRAASLVPNRDASCEAWFRNASQSIIGFEDHIKDWCGSTNPPPFHLLAVVNRFDLATPNGDGSQWNDAEIRFVYGLVGAPGGDAPRFTLILEFVLKPLCTEKFAEYQRKWASLSPLDQNKLGTEISTITSDQLRDPKTARLRTNSSLGGSGGVWRMAQWKFDSTFPNPAALDDQICAKYVNGTANREERERFAAIWRNYTGELHVDVRSLVEPSLAKYENTKVVDSPRESCGMPTGMGVENPNPTARNVLSLQQCTFCHSGETGTDFMHIQNRDPGKLKAELSPFLVGKGSRLALDVIKRGDANFEPRVVFNTNVAKDGPYCNGKTDKTTRKFNDLARRRLFMWVALSIPPNVKETPSQLLEYLRESAPDFRH